MLGLAAQIAVTVAICALVPPLNTVPDQPTVLGWLSLTPSTRSLPTLIPPPVGTAPAGQAAEMSVPAPPGGVTGIATVLDE